MPPVRSVLSKLGRSRRAWEITSDGSIRSSITPPAAKRSPSKLSEGHMSLPYETGVWKGLTDNRKGGGLPSGVAHYLEGSKESEPERTSHKVEQRNLPMLA